jgi:hypothetical protein
LAEHIELIRWGNDRDEEVVMSRAGWQCG